MLRRLSARVPPTVFQKEPIFNMCRILLLTFTLGSLFASVGCRCCPQGAAYNPCYGPYNPYAGNCVNEDIWTKPGTGHGRHYHDHQRHSGHADCDCHGYQQPAFSDCGCGAPVSGDCGCGAPTVSDCGCSGGYPLSGYEVGQPQIIYGEPTYGTPTSVPGPPQAPPTSEEEYIPPTPDDFDSATRNTGHRGSTLPSTLVVPARL